MKSRKKLRTSLISRCRHPLERFAHNNRTVKSDQEGTGVSLRRAWEMFDEFEWDTEDLTSTC